MLLLIVSGYFFTQIFDKRYLSVSDFEKVRLTNYRSYMRSLGWRLRDSRIVIEADGKEYYLFYDSTLIPDGVEFKDFIPILNNSTEVILWLAEYSSGKSVNGLQVDGQLIIPPIQGVKRYEVERRWAIVLCVMFLVIGIIYYRTFKELGFDWKLSPKS
jgi:hypothetical protein